MKLCEKTTVFLVVTILLGFFFLYTNKESFDTPPINPPKENKKPLRLMNEAFEETPPAAEPTPPSPSPAPTPGPLPPAAPAPSPPPAAPAPPGPLPPPSAALAPAPHYIHPKPWHHAYTPWFWQPRYFPERRFYGEPIERIYITEKVPTETNVNTNILLGTVLLGFATLLAFRL